MTRLVTRLLLCLALLPWGLGCTAPLESQVNGTVTLDGKPLDKGNVSFLPVGSGTPAYGSIGADGRYEVKTGQGEGLKPGDYVVVVKATTEIVASDEPGAHEVLPELLTPKAYADKGTSPLKFTVAAGSQTIDLPLSSRPQS